MASKLELLMKYRDTYQIQGHFKNTKNIETKYPVVESIDFSLYVRWDVCAECRITVILDFRLIRAVLQDLYAPAGGEASVSGRPGACCRSPIGVQRMCWY